MENALLKEITLNKVRTDATFSLKSIGGGNKNIKRETLLQNLNRIINQTDISLVDYTTGGVPSNKPLQPISKLFCDNIIVYCCIDDKLVAEIANKNNNAGDTQIINEAAKEMLACFTQEVKRVFNHLNININKCDIKPTNANTLTSDFTYKTSKQAQFLKINLSNIDVNNVFDLLEDENKIAYLHENNVFIRDVDFTKDYKGVFNKKNVEKYLIEEHDFVKQGQPNPDENPTILDNSQTVSNNCLTFINTADIGTIRYKFYNKFVQSMESPSVRGKVGSHINDWVNNPEPILRDAIKNSLETGLLRLEFTLYVYNVKNNVSKHSIITEMDYLEKLMPPHLIYYNSISNQFNLLCNNILYNICIVDLENDLAFISLYQNKLTSKINGYYLYNINSTKLSNALRWYCSNKPIIVILMQFDNINDEINIQQDTYLRIPKNNINLYTYISKGCESIKAVVYKEYSNKPEQMGLIPNNVFNFTYPSTSPSLLKSSAKTDILFTNFDMPLLSYPNSSITIRNLNKVLREDLQENNFNEQFEHKIQTIINKNAEIEEEIQRSKYREMVRNKIYKILSFSRIYTNKLIDIDDNTNIYVYGFKETYAKYGKTYILICCLKDSIAENTDLKLYWATSNIQRSLQNLIDKNNFKQLDINGIVAYGSLTRTPLITLRKNGTYYNKSRNLCANISISKYTPNAHENININENDLLEQIDVSAKKCRKIDEVVKPGDIIKIIGYKTLKSSLLIRCIINNKTDNYLATYWLKETLLERIHNGYNRHIEVIVGIPKTTPQKQKAYIYKL